MHEENSELMLSGVSKRAVRIACNEMPAVSGNMDNRDSQPVDVDYPIHSHIMSSPCSCILRIFFIVLFPENQFSNELRSGKFSWGNNFSQNK